MPCQRIVDCPYVHRAAFRRGTCSSGYPVASVLVRLWKSSLQPPHWRNNETASVVCASMEVLKRVVDPKSTKLSYISLIWKYPMILGTPKLKSTRILCILVALIILLVCLCTLKWWSTHHTPLLVVKSTCVFCACGAKSFEFVQKWWRIYL